MKTSDFKIGDIIKTTRRNKIGTRFEYAEVTDINYKGNGLVTFIGHYGRGAAMATGQGSFDPSAIPLAKPFGMVCDVEIVGHTAPFNPWSPKPGDRGYD